MTSTTSAPTFRRMMQEVVRTGACSGCGTCVVVCPYDVLQYEDGKPVQHVLESLPDWCIVAECIDCDICAQACPRLDPSAEDLDRSVFGRPRLSEDEPFGVYRQVLLARTRDARIASASQDGGVVTTLLARALERGDIDASLVTGGEAGNPWGTTPAVASSREELLASAGSRYTYSPNPMAMLDAVGQAKRRVALVGTPCEISPVAKAREAGLAEYVDRVALTIGLLCNEAFTYDGLMEQKIAREMSIPLDDVVKVNIKGKVLVHLRSGDVREIPLKEAKEYARPECFFCPDFSAEYADLSVGGLGQDGWTLVIVRSEAGEAAFQAAVDEGLFDTNSIESAPEVYDLLLKMTRRQRRRAARTQAAMAAQQAPAHQG